MAFSLRRRPEFDAVDAAPAEGAACQEPPFSALVSGRYQPGSPDPIPPGPIPPGPISHDPISHDPTPGAPARGRSGSASEPSSADCPSPWFALGPDQRGRPDHPDGPEPDPAWSRSEAGTAYPALQQLTQTLAARPLVGAPLQRQPQAAWRGQPVDAGRATSAPPAVDLYARVQAAVDELPVLDPPQPVERFPDLDVPVPSVKRRPRRLRMTSASGAPAAPAPDVPIRTAVRAYQASLEYVAWKPRLSSLVISLLVLAVYGVWSFHPNRTPLGWVLTVVWSMPIVGTLVGIQGAVLLRRRVHRQGRMAPPTIVTQDALVVVVPTIGRHDTHPALERSVLSFVEHLPIFFTHFRADVVVEQGCEAAQRIAVLATRHPQIRVITVPRTYVTPRGTRFKARANHYAHELRIAEGEARDDVWVLHMDDDTAVGGDTAAALAQFVNRQRRAGAEGKHLAQGILTYPRENAVNWLTWMADAVRPADDFARFRAVTGSGTPVAGVHGELLLLRASVEATIGWDFGPKAIVEDAQFALTFCKLYPGRSDWFNGRCYGASPATIRDFIKQRERWAWGLVGLTFNRTIPLRYRAFIGWSVLTWVLGPLQHLGIVLLVAWALGATSTSPVTESVLLLWATNFAYVIWSYWEGLRLNTQSSRRPGRRWFELLLVLLLIPVFALMEGIGGLRGFLKFLTRRENKFVVIAKPA